MAQCSETAKKRPPGQSSGRLPPSCASAIAQQPTIKSFKAVIFSQHLNIFVSLSAAHHVRHVVRRPFVPWAGLSNIPLPLRSKSCSSVVSCRSITSSRHRLTRVVAMSACRQLIRFSSVSSNSCPTPQLKVDGSSRFRLRCSAVGMLVKAWLVVPAGAVVQRPFCPPYVFSVTCLHMCIPQKLCHAEVNSVALGPVAQDETVALPIESTDVGYCSLESSRKRYGSLLQDPCSSATFLGVGMP